MPTAVADPTCLFARPAELVVGQRLRLRDGDAEALQELSREGVAVRDPVHLSERVLLSFKSG